MTKNVTNEKKKALTSRELTSAQLKVISLSLAGVSIEDIAKEIKISRTMIYRWLKQDLFQETLDLQRQEIFERGITRLKSAVDLAVIVLINALGSNNPSLQRLAAKDILSLALKTVQDKEIEERLERLEAIIKERYIS